MVTYLLVEEVVELIVSLEPFAFLWCFLLFAVLLLIVSDEVLLVEVFWANTAEPDKRPRLRAAIMIFFILEYLLNSLVIALGALREYGRKLEVKES